MADGAFWDRRLAPSPQPPKRPRSDYDLASGASHLERPNYLQGEDDHVGLQPLRDPTSIGKSYDLYLQNAVPYFVLCSLQSSLCKSCSCALPFCSMLVILQKKLSFGSVETGNISGSGLAMSVDDGVFDAAFVHIPFRDPIMNQVNMGVSDPGTRGLRVIKEGPFVSQVPMDSGILPVVPGQGLLLPPDASNSIFVEGLPRDCTEREVAHIFRPFLGYKETRLVRKEPKHQDGDQKILCFVDFTNVACAMTAMNALQGYKMDERRPDSPLLHLKFSKGPDPQSGHGSHRERSGRILMGERSGLGPQF